ncbi:hypothetical protein NliqN6_1287 [Naganishia liquefaciens]|uniref:WIBG Mago-binding domain-containing protein n=1 Tax=Naganishia liquefaciens TaxID=104408 RepID=A0A8H3TQS0_9TREE|nr:hypothetical protein NliqN6_1287 [Naganishia liquefaciens]
MDSYPWEPAQSTSGIVKDPSVGKRVVPPSVRKDGSQRKELRIRDGYVPIEDRIAYKSRGKVEAERMKGFVVGATSATPSTYAIPSVKANDPTQGMTKAQKKNYQRKLKKLEEKSARNWDSEDEDESGGEENKAEGSAKAAAVKPVKQYEAKAQNSDEEPNDRFDIHQDSDDARQDEAINQIEVPELGVKPEFGVGFNKACDPIKGFARPPRPGGIFRDLGLKPKSSGSTAQVTDKDNGVASAEPVKTKPTTAAASKTAPKRSVPGAAPTANTTKDAPRQRPEVRVRPGHGLAGMMKQLAVQDSTSVRR